MGEVAADGPARADRGMRNMPQCLGQQWNVPADLGVTQDRFVPNEGTDTQPAVADRDPGQTRNAANVDQD
jgi:hypothetical protein